MQKIIPAKTIPTIFTNILGASIATMTAPEKGSIKKNKKGILHLLFLGLGNQTLVCNTMHNIIENVNRVYG